jgi:FAD/FMN-containing dehydrogenase
MTVTARSADGQSITIDGRLIDAFKPRLRGSLLSETDAGYDESRTIWNAMIDRRPAMVVRCLGTADVIASVAFARETGIAISIKGGGHNIAGLAVCDGGLLLDMSRMRGVWVDPARRTARAQAGCLLGDIDRETQVHGLAAPFGFISNTGLAGLTLGGGFGYLTRRFGWTSDALLSVDVVTADGRLVHASEDEHADLFWALRGGGGNFGVVTSFEYRLRSIGPEILGGAIAWPAADAPRVLELFRKTAASAPPELTCVAGLRKAPPAPWLPKSIHGQDMVAFFICYTGPIEEGERLMAPIRQCGTPCGDVVQRRTYVSQQSLIDATQPAGRRYYWKSEYLPGHSEDLVTSAIEHAKRMPSPHSVVALFPLDGALNSLPMGHSAVGNRDAKSVFNIGASWERPEDDRANIDWARAAWEDLRRFSTGGTYINFLTEEETGARVEAAYGANYGRLADVKSRWDPENLFRANKNIQPERR